MAIKFSNEGAADDWISLEEKGADAGKGRKLNSPWILGVMLVFAVVLAYEPVWHAGFIWDDDAHLTANPCIVGPLGLRQIWTTEAARICPLVLTTFWVEHSLWGLAPLPYHLLNVFIHAASAIVLWRILLGLQMPGAWFGAALWALHPVQVETVAWVTEMKNTQSGLFYLLSIHFFVKQLRSERGGWDYPLALLFAALAMASKSSTVVLPLVFSLCAWWVEGRLRRRTLMQIAPTVLMSAAAAALSMWTQNLEGANNQPWRSWPARFITAGKVVWFYLGKLLWPHPLMFIYPRWVIDIHRWTSYLPLLALIGLFLIFWLNRHLWSRPCLFALVYFVVALLPVLGLAEHFFLRYSFVGDHFQYLASMGCISLGAAGLAVLTNAVIPKKLWLQEYLCAGLLLVFGILTWQRAHIFQNSERLWINAVLQNPNCWIGYCQLSHIALEQGQVNESSVLAQKTLKINPDCAEAHNNLGIVFIRKGRVGEAIAEYQRALQINPKMVQSCNNLGLALLQEGQVDEAIAQFQNAVEINPYFSDGFNNLGTAFAKEGRIDEEIAQFQKALEVTPGFFQIRNNLGAALANKGRLDEAITEFQKVVEAAPSYVEARDNLGDALLQKGRVEEAKAQFQKVLEIDPANSRARRNLDRLN